MRKQVLVLLFLVSSVLLAQAVDFSPTIDVIPIGRSLGIGIYAPSEILSVNGSIAIVEGTAPTEVDGYGKLYVKSSDNNLYFKNSGGAEFNLVTGSGVGTVSSVDVVNANGVNGTVANPTTTPAITITLKNIHPSSVFTESVRVNGANLGDLFYSSSNGTLVALPAGSNGQLLTIVNGLPAWKEERLANDIYGSLADVSPDSSGDIITYTPGADYLFTGFNVFGMADARFSILIDGDVKYALMTDVAEPNATLILPTPVLVPEDTVIILRVDNTSNNVATFEGTIFGK